MMEVWPSWQIVVFPKHTNSIWNIGMRHHFLFPIPNTTVPFNFPNFGTIYSLRILDSCSPQAIGWCTLHPNYNSAGCYLLCASGNFWGPRGDGFDGSSPASPVVTTGWGALDSELWGTLGPGPIVKCCHAWWHYDWVVMMSSQTMSSQTMSSQIVLRRSRLDDFADATLWVLCCDVHVLSLRRFGLAAEWWRWRDGVGSFVTCGDPHNLLTQLAATTCCRELAASRRVTGERHGFPQKV